MLFDLISKRVNYSHPTLRRKTGFVCYPSQIRTANFLWELKTDETLFGIFLLSCLEESYWALVVFVEA